MSSTWSVVIDLPAEDFDPAGDLHGLTFDADHTVTPAGWGLVSIDGGSPQTFQSHRDAIGAETSVRYLLDGVTRGATYIPLNAMDLLIGHPTRGGAMTLAEDITNGWQSFGDGVWRRAVDFVPGTRVTTVKGSGPGQVEHGVLFPGGNIRHGYPEALFVNNGRDEWAHRSSLAAVSTGNDYFIDYDARGNNQHWIYIKQNPAQFNLIELVHNSPEGHFWVVSGETPRLHNLVIDKVPSYAYRGGLGGELGPRVGSAGDLTGVNRDMELKYVTVRRCSAVGVRIGDGALLENVLIERNGHMGYILWAQNPARKGSRPVKFKNCRIRENKTRDYHSGTAGGGGKAGEGIQSGYIYENCDLSNNFGPGFWHDWFDQETPWGLTISCRIQGNWDHGYLNEAADATFDRSYSLQSGAISCPSHGLYVGACIHFRGDNLPDGIEEWKPYFVHEVISANRFSIADSYYASSPLTLTGNSGGSIRGYSAAIWNISRGNGWTKMGAGEGGAHTGRGGFQMVLSNSRRAVLYENALNRTHAGNNGNGGLGFHDEQRNKKLTGSAMIGNRVSSNGGVWGKNAAEADSANASSFTGTDLHVDGNEYFGSLKFRIKPNNLSFAQWQTFGWDENGSTSTASATASLPAGAVAYDDSFHAGALVDPIGYD